MIPSEIYWKIFRMWNITQLYSNFSSFHWSRRPLHVFRPSVIGTSSLQIRTNIMYKYECVFFQRGTLNNLKNEFQRSSCFYFASSSAPDLVDLIIRDKCLPKQACNHLQRNLISYRYIYIIYLIYHVVLDCPACFHHSVLITLPTNIPLEMQLMQNSILFTMQPHTSLINKIKHKQYVNQLPRFSYKQQSI